VHVIIKNSFLPIFNHLKNVHSGSDSQNQKHNIDIKAIGSIQKKLSDLDISLLQSSKSFFPDVTFNYDPEVVKFIRMCNVQNKEVKVENFPKEILDNNDFVNGLGQNVNRWKQLIVLLQDTSEKAAFDTVLDEVNFYTNFLTNLEIVNKQINSNETELTKQLLNVKKKYHVVIGFDRDYNFSTYYNNIRQTAEFMRSFPINDL